ncbi:MAG: transketolase [Clostridia bacterium]|nr:transketolase [Clostridia bacterium]
MLETRKKELTKIAYELRKAAVTAVYSAASGHPGGSLSIAEILTYLYFEEMNIDPKDPAKADRDRFVLSKGHASPAIYAALALRGYFPVDDLKTFRQVDSVLQGHPDMKHIPGIDMTTGSLGLGISAACGMALGAKKNGIGNRVWAIIGDGESEEGQVWEAAMFAAHYKLDNLCVFADFNGLQIDGPVAEVMNPAPLGDKFRAFGWNVIEIDAHDLDAIEAAVALAKATKGKPTAVIATSTKGKGVSYMENNVSWHGSAPKQEQYEQAIAELDAAIAAI